MPKVMNMPKIGVNMTDAKIVAWVIKEGDTIKEGDHILDAETDKAVQEIYSSMSGIIAKILVPVGEDVLCQTPIVILCEPDEKLEEAFLKQFMEVDVNSADVGHVKVDSSDKQTETGKGNVIEVGNQSVTGQNKFVSDERRTIIAEEKPILSKISGSQDLSVTSSVDGKNRIRISPLARKLAKNMNIGLNELHPAKPNARIVKSDVLAYASGRSTNPVSVKEKNRGTIAYTGIRRLIGERMTESKRTKPSVSLTLHADAGILIEWRNKLKKAGKAVGYNDMLVFIVARALSEQPIINSRLEPGENEIQLLSNVNIGVAVDTEKGLTVPVIKNADKKGLLEISEEFRAKVEAVKAGKASLEDLTGGTFTITNLGAYEIESFTPIINPPECCILGVGSILREPVVGENDIIVIKSRMLLTLVFDHRIVDGAPAAKFLKKVKHLIEWPLELMN